MLQFLRIGNLFLRKNRSFLQNGVRRKSILIKFLIATLYATVFFPIYNPTAIAFRRSDRSSNVECLTLRFA